MLATVATALALVSSVIAHPWSHDNGKSDSSLTVKTRTGTFVGNLNDTYPNVRQFKYIPYAKVGAFTSHSIAQLTGCSLQLESIDGQTHENLIAPPRCTTPQSLGLHVLSLSLQFLQPGLSTSLVISLSTMEKA